MNATLPTLLARHASGLALLLSLAGFSGCTHTQPPPTAAKPPPAATQPAASQPISAQPAAKPLQQVVNEAYAKFKDDKTGKNADYIPYLASVPSNLFGVCIVTADGRVFTAGDVNYSFSIQSCSKVFT